jgi:hypothetical protein
MLMDLEFMLLDTFDNLRAKNMPRIETLTQAEELCNRILEAESVYFEDIPDTQNKKYQNVVEVIKSLWTKEPVASTKNNKK